MRLLYRADGGHPIGTGHLFRAQRILWALAELGPIDATLALSEDEAGLRIAAECPAELAVLPPRRDTQAIKPRFEFGPVSGLIREKQFDLVVVDMLDTGDTDMEALAATGVPVATFDDRGPGRWFADVIVNILVDEPEPESLPPTLQLFEGPAYAVLDPEYHTACGAWRWRETTGRVLVSLGGGDAAGLCVRVANALRLVDGIRHVDFTVGPAFRHREELDQTVVNAPWSSAIHTGLPSLLPRYLECDLALVAGGLTMFEVCCVGVPSIAVCQPIDHQFELAERLSAAGAMESVGYGLEASLEEIAARTTRVLDDEYERKWMSQRGPRLVDGHGVDRVASILAGFAV